MCRGGHDDNAPRRCPSSFGHDRSARDRARNAAKAAASFTLNEAPRRDPRELNLGTRAPSPVAIPDPPRDWTAAELKTLAEDVSRRAFSGIPGDKQGLIAEYGSVDCAIQAVGKAISDRAMVRTDFYERTLHEAAARDQREARRKLDDVKARLDLAVIEQREQEAKAAQGPLPSRKRQYAAALADLEAARADPDLVAANQAVTDAKVNQGPGVLRWIGDLRTQYLDALSDIRPMGATMPVHPLSDSGMQAHVDHVAQYYPSGWSEYASQDPLPIVTEVDGRAGYAHHFDHTFLGQTIRAPRLQTRPDNGATPPGGAPHDRATIHELAHRMEAVVPRLRDLEHDHVEIRARAYNDDQLGETIRIHTMYQAPDSGDDEKGYRGGYATNYTGRMYGDDPSKYREHGTEVLSTGMEALFTGSYGGYVGTNADNEDPQSRHFILGLLATV